MTCGGLPRFTREKFSNIDALAPGDTINTRNGLPVSFLPP